MSENSEMNLALKHHLSCFGKDNKKNCFRNSCMLLRSFTVNATNISGELVLVCDVDAVDDRGIV